LFGGEALLISLPELEELLAIGYEKWKSTGVQTNGTLITPKHVELFERYNTHVGISLDGPDDLNDSRWAGTLEATRKATEKTFRAIDMLLARVHETGNTRLIPSLIITLHGKNTTLDGWPRMKAWLSEMDMRGIRSFNFHVMELDAEATKDSEWYIPHDRMKEVMLDLWELSTTWVNASAINFKEIIDLLRANDRNVMCVWRACDPWNTSAVQGLEGDGSPSHCTRTNKDGIDWMPAEGFGEASKWQIGNFPMTNRSHERQLSLYVTPQEHGGCQGCRFWVMCMGQCPGTGEESVTGQYGDWRLRTTYCQTWKDLFEEGERRLLEIGEMPVTQSPVLATMEQIMYTGWTHGKNIPMSTAKDIAEGKLSLSTILGTPARANSHGDGHGDHSDAALLGGRPEQPHGDHTDAAIVDQRHGDHTDNACSPMLEVSVEDNQHGDHTDVIPHGDHTDEAPEITPPIEHGDHTDITPHGDHVDESMVQQYSPHGDGHGDDHADHLDYALAQPRKRTSGEQHTTTDGKRIVLW
jgi:uncharacterized protein